MTDREQVEALRKAYEDGMVRGTACEFANNGGLKALREAACRAFPMPKGMHERVLSDDFIDESLTRYRHETRAKYARYIEEAVLERIR